MDSVAMLPQDMLQAENDTFNSGQSFKVYLSISIKKLPDIVTGYASNESHRNTGPMPVHLPIRFERSFRLNRAEIIKILPREVNRKMGRCLRNAQAGKRKSAKALGRRRGLLFYITPQGGTSGRLGYGFMGKQKLLVDNCGPSTAKQEAKAVAAISARTLFR